MKIRNVLAPLAIMLAGSISGCTGGPDGGEARSIFMGLAYQWLFPDTARKIENHAKKSGGVMDVSFLNHYWVFKYGTSDVLLSNGPPHMSHRYGSSVTLSDDTHAEPQFMHMTIYLDGDLSGWDKPYPQRDSVSAGNYMMLDKALSDPTPSLYLVLTCDTPDKDEGCQSEQWKKKRFSEGAVDAISHELDALVRRNGVANFSLVGFGSGASIAIALASQRNDIYSLTTLSGVIDPLAAAKAAGENDLIDVADPLVNTKKLALIPQRHYVVDSKDDASSMFVDAYAKKVGGTCTEVVKVPSRIFFSWSSVTYQQMNIPGPRCR